MKSRGEQRIDGDYHEVEFISISVSDPVKISDGTEEFTRYKISTETTFPEYKARSFVVYRRYKQFASLRAHLKARLALNPKAIKFGELPALPGNTISSLLSHGARFDPKFVDNRRAALEDWINTVAQHNFFRFEGVLHSFIQDEEFKCPD